MLYSELFGWIMLVWGLLALLTYAIAKSWARSINLETQFPVAKDWTKKAKHARFRDRVLMIVGEGGLFASGFAIFGMVPMELDSNVQAAINSVPETLQTPFWIFMLALFVNSLFATGLGSYPGRLRKQGKINTNGIVAVYMTSFMLGIFMLGAMVLTITSLSRPLGTPEVVHVLLSVPAPLYFMTIALFLMTGAIIPYSLVVIYTVVLEQRINRAIVVTTDVSPELAPVMMNNPFMRQGSGVGTYYVMRTLPTNWERAREAGNDKGDASQDQATSTELVDKVMEHLEPVDLTTTPPDVPQAALAPLAKLNDKIKRLLAINLGGVMLYSMAAYHYGQVVVAWQDYAKYAKGFDFLDVLTKLSTSNKKVSRVAYAAYAIPAVVMGLIEFLQLVIPIGPIIGFLIGALCFLGAMEVVLLFVVISMKQRIRHDAGLRAEMAPLLDKL
nr:hypothetical protein [Candidatus Sigynarchaeota archaeon]